MITSTSELYFLLSSLSLAFSPTTRSQSLQRSWRDSRTLSHNTLLPVGTVRRSPSRWTTLPLPESLNLKQGAQNSLMRIPWKQRTLVSSRPTLLRAPASEWWSTLETTL